MSAQIFGERLCAAIAASGMRKCDIARKAELTDASHLHHFCSGRITPTLAVLRRLLDALPNTDARWLIGCAKRKPGRRLKGKV